jgi:hypothetical protein
VTDQEAQTTEIGWTDILAPHKLKAEWAAFLKDVQIQPQSIQ